MKKCPNASRLTALREGWLDPHDVKSLLAHIDGCRECHHTMAELDAVVGLLAHEAGPVEQPPGGWEALHRSVLARRDQLPPPEPRFSRWMRRAVAAAAMLLLLLTAVLVRDHAMRPPEVTVSEVAESADWLDSLIEEHALASDRIPFSDGTYMILLTQREDYR